MASRFGAGTCQRTPELDLLSTNKKPPAGSLLVAWVAEQYLNDFIFRQRLYKLRAQACSVVSFADHVVIRHA